mmetsp:Transcript_80583/g.250060  ORF Transcript_80583/g.250060 Transcript_80583/m.250060 type:complete len:184 (-) Transcript_80583:167-718(-)
MAVCLKLSSFVLATVLAVSRAQDCSTGPEKYTKGYDISDCVAEFPNTLSLRDCRPKCAEHYEGTPTVDCVFVGTGYEFRFDGCTRKKLCRLPANTEGYDLSKCKSTSIDGLISTDECEVSCLPYHRNTSMSAAACVVFPRTSHIGYWYLHGCQKMIFRGAAKGLIGHFLAKLLLLGAVFAGIR